MISDYDGNWYPETADDLIKKTDQNFILHREWAKKRAMEMLAGTEIGRRMVNMISSKKKK